MKMDHVPFQQTELGQEEEKMSANNSTNSLRVSASKDASVSADKSVKPFTIKIEKV